MDVVAIKEAFDWLIVRACLSALAALLVVLTALQLHRFGNHLIKKLAKRYGWPLVAFFVACSAWATRTAFPTSEEKNGGGVRSFNFSTHSLIQARLLPEDFARGFVLTHVGTNEVYDFIASSNALVCSDWRLHGAAEDWIYLTDAGLGLNSEKLRVHSDGAARVFREEESSFTARDYCPFKTLLGVVPEANWCLTGNGERGTGNGSLFWHEVTSHNTLKLTWQNVLYNRETNTPVSFQVEYCDNGDFVYRYDLSSIKNKILSGEWNESCLSNVVIGAAADTASQSFSIDTSFTSLPFCDSALKTNVLAALRMATLSSLTFQRLDPSDTPGSDFDGDGLTIEDELFVYRTDPYNADTDYDGLSDYDEIFNVKSNPLDAYSISPDYHDALAYTLQGEDPFVYPEGSTNTVLEHVFYSGETNGVFTRPGSTASTAVLKVGVSGTGSGRLVIGGKVIPLVAPPAMTRSGVNITELFAGIERGVKHIVRLFAPPSLSLQLESDDFVFGELPSGGKTSGWLVAPVIEITSPCYHWTDPNPSETVSISPGESCEELSVAWSLTNTNGKITKTSRFSAEITGAIKPLRSSSIRALLSHPKRLFGLGEYSAPIAFCPKLEEEEFGQIIGGDNDVICECCDNGCVDCEEECGCECGRCLWRLDEDDDDEGYTNAVVKAATATVIIREGAQKRIFVEAPDGGTAASCCGCPDHAGLRVSAAFSSAHIKVRKLDDTDFGSSPTGLYVKVEGVSPSYEFDDAHLLIAETGAVKKVHAFTVLGLDIASPTADLKAVNSLDEAFGYPLAVCTNWLNAAEFDLKSDVLLSEGFVRFEISGASARFKVQRKDKAGVWHDFLDTATGAVFETNIVRWRREYLSDALRRTTRIRIVGLSPGSCALCFAFAAENGDLAVKDRVEQRITAIAPPLLPDYNGDGVVDGDDEEFYVKFLPYRFWCNEDTVDGDYLGAGDVSVPNADDLVVNGRWDLVNLFAVAMRLEDLTSRWSASRVRYEIASDTPATTLKATMADVAWNALRSVQTAGVTTVAGENLHEAHLVDLSAEGISYTASSYGEGSGLFLAEASGWEQNALVLKVIVDGAEAMRFKLPLSISPVRFMYRWLNSRWMSGGNVVRQTDLSEPLNGSYGLDGAVNLIFLHGANVSESEAEIWGDVIFKRLWHSGARVNFYNVDWRSDIGSPANYHENASNAFVVASQIASTINAIPGEKAIMAHSLGNMVVSSMIQDYGLEVSKYLMCNSAVPAEAYDRSLSLRVSQLVHPDWEEYPTNSWAASWHSLFENDTNDDRKHLGWSGRFADVIQYAVNFYSTGDEVLELSADNDVDILTGITSSLAHHAWHKQELFKGRGLGVGMGATDWSGWNIEENWLGITKISVEEAQMMNDADFKTNTVFYCYPSSMNAPNIPLLVRGAHLALGIPALTPAAGVTDLSVILDQENSFNLDLTDSGIEHLNGWPSKSNYSNRFLHSDIKDVSYFFNFKVYEKLIEKGGMR